MIHADIFDQIKYIINLGQVQKALIESSNKSLLTTHPQKHHQKKKNPRSPRRLCFVGDRDFMCGQLQPKWKGPYQVLPNIATEIKLPQIYSFIHLSGIKFVLLGSLQEPSDDNSALS